MPITDLNLNGPVVIPSIGMVAYPGGGRVRYVYQDSSGNGVASLSDVTASLQDTADLTVAAALGKCRANRGDIIVCLPGHVETIGAAAWTPVAGVTVVGYGNGDERPTFNWTAAASAIASTVANFRVTNCILNFAATAATTVTKAWTTSGARNIIDNCRIIAGGAGGTQLATTGIELTTGADRFLFQDNEVYAPTDAAVVNMIKLTNAVDNCRIYGNVMDVGLSTTASSMVVMTVAPTNIRIGGNGGRGNVIRNGIASSTKCLVGITAATGYVEYNQGYITAATGGATAFGTLGSLQLTQNYGCAGGAVTGILIGTASS